MNTEAWPFLIGRNQTLGYRVLVSPQFIAQYSLSPLLAEAASGDESSPGSATGREIHGSVVGQLSLIFRVTKALGQEYGLEEKGILRDEVGRSIYLISGFVVRGSLLDFSNGGISSEEFKRVHSLVKGAYHDFWSAREDSFPERRSEAFLLQPAIQSTEVLTLKEVSPFIVALTPPNRPVSPPIRNNGNTRRRNSILIVALSLLLLCIGGTLIYRSIFQSNTPQQTLNAFCQNLQIPKPNYQGAYAQLSQNVQQTLTQQQFSNYFSQQYGKITSCSSQLGTQSNAIQQATLVISHAQGRNSVRIILLQDSTNKWRINTNIIDVLQ